MVYLYRNFLERTPNRQSYIAIVDDLKSDHMAPYEHLLKNLILHGLKLHPPPQKMSVLHEELGILR